MQINRRSFADYGTSLKALTNEELHQEIWALSEHIKYLTECNEDASVYREFVIMAREEKEVRMVAQGYQ